MTDKVKKKPVSEDLEQAAIDYCSGNKGADARVRAGYIEGAKWKEEQMMAKAIAAVVSQVPCSNEIILYNPSSVYKYSLPQEMNKLGLNKGDKVKVIIIKSE